MPTVEQYLAELPLFADLDEPTLTLLAGCAADVHFGADQYLFREGEAADRFWVIRHGRVRIELSTPAGEGAVLHTIDDGGVVGWSWLVPPYRWVFDAHTSQGTSAVAFDAAVLRGKCHADPKLGFELMQLVAQVMRRQFESTRTHLLDMYGEIRD